MRTSRERVQKQGFMTLPKSKTNLHVLSNQLQLLVEILPQKRRSERRLTLPWVPNMHPKSSCPSPQLPVTTATETTFPETEWQEKKRIMLTGQKCRQGIPGTACLCSMISGASVSLPMSVSMEALRSGWLGFAHSSVAEF